MAKRPLYVTLICWLLILVVGLNLVTTLYTLSRPELLEPVMNLRKLSPIPIVVQFVILTIDLCVMLASGIVMLRRRNWARWLFVLWIGFSSLLGLLTVPYKMTVIPGLVCYLVAVLLLFLPGANRYFNATVPAYAENA